jgi:hypothetical protein
MIARHILLVVGLIFLLFATLRISKERRVGPAARAWLVVGVIFLVVSLTLSR